MLIFLFSLGGDVGIWFAITYPDEVAGALDASDDGALDVGALDAGDDGTLDTGDDVALFFLFFFFAFFLLFLILLFLLFFFVFFFLLFFFALLRVGALDTGDNVASVPL